MKCQSNRHDRELGSGVVPSKRTGFKHLLREPLRIGMRSDSRMHELTGAVVDDKEYIQCSKPDGLNRKQITRPDLVGVLMQELSPTGGGRSIVWTSHVSGDSSRTSPKAKTCQFRLDSALSPQGLLPSHAANELAEFGVNLPASSSRKAA